MLWTIAVILLILWMLGLVIGFAMGSVIHIIFAVAVALLVVSLSQEVMINQKLRHVLRSRGPKRDGKRRREPLADQPIPSRIMP
jgi:low affinity Fe/Cu permease